MRDSYFRSYIEHSSNKLKKEQNREEESHCYFMLEIISGRKKLFIKNVKQRRNMEKI